MKITIKQLNQSIFIFTVLASIAILAFVSYFLYYNFYTVITQTTDIIILKKTVLTENLDINKFNQAIQKIEEKTESQKPKNIPDIFTKAAP